jgi:hypothetical protein
VLLYAHWYVHRYDLHYALLMLLKTPKRSLPV